MILDRHSTRHILEVLVKMMAQLNTEAMHGGLEYNVVLTGEFEGNAVEAHVDSVKAARVEDEHLIDIAHHKVVPASAFGVWFERHSDHSQPLPPGRQYHFFLSHKQANGGDQAHALKGTLEQLGYRCW
jgi:hypothetical protein